MSALTTAITAWGDDIPDWVRVLAETCDSSSQSKVATLIGYSPTYVSWVINNKCLEKKVDLTAVKQSVEGALMAHTVNCPVLGEMRADICLQHQKREFRATNHVRVRLYKACRNGCPNSRIGGR